MFFLAKYALLSHFILNAYFYMHSGTLFPPLRTASQNLRRITAFYSSTFVWVVRIKSVLIRICKGQFPEARHARWYFD